MVDSNKYRKSHHSNISPSPLDDIYFSEFVNMSLYLLEIPGKRSLPGNSIQQNFVTPLGNSKVIKNEDPWSISYGNSMA